MMKNREKKLIALLLSLMLFLSLLPVQGLAEEIEIVDYETEESITVVDIDDRCFPQWDVTNYNWFLKQETGSKKCTLVSNVMMLRRRAILEDDTNWESITTESVGDIAWTSSGMKFEYRYNGKRVYSYGMQSELGLSLGDVTGKKQYFIENLITHPEGIVIYVHHNSNYKHAVLLTRYDSATDTFYCADPAPSIGSGEIPLNSSLLPSYIKKSYPNTGLSDQDLVIGYVQQTWMIIEGSGEITPCTHQYQTVQDETGNYVGRCKLCGYVYSPVLQNDSRGTYRITANGNYCSAPYQDAITNKTYKTGQEVNVIGHVINAYNNKWYKTEDNYYIYWSYATWIETTPFISISGATMPEGNLPANQGFTLKGIIEAYPDLNNVTVKVVNPTTGDAINGFYYSVNPNAATYNIQTDGANAALKFGNLPAGNYRYLVTAQNASVSKTLISSDFTIVSGSTTHPVPPDAPSVSVNGQSVTVSWNDVENETGYDVYLVQSPWRWEDIKYSANLSANTTTYTFTNVAVGEYRAFVISRPNANTVQSEWTAFDVVGYETPDIWLSDENVEIDLSGDNSATIHYYYSGSTEYGYYLTAYFSDQGIVDWTWNEDETITFYGIVNGHTDFYISLIEYETERCLDTAVCHITAYGANEPIPLTLGVEETAVITDGGSYARFSFTPNYTASYDFVSFSERDTYGGLYNAEGICLAEDDDSGKDSNFKIRFELQAGETYYYGARFYYDEDTGSFPVILITSDSTWLEARAEEIDVKVPYGHSATLEVVTNASDSSDLSYSWYRGELVFDAGGGYSYWFYTEDGNLGDLNTNAIVINSVTDCAPYLCKVEDSYGNVADVWFFVAVQVHFDAWAAEENVYTYTDQPVTLEVIAESDEPEKITYQWLEYREIEGSDGDNTWTDWRWVEVDGATESIFITPSITNDTRYLCRVSEGYGEMRIITFNVFAEAAPTESLTISLSNETARPGDTVNVAVELSDNPGIMFLQLRFDYDTTRLDNLSFSEGDILSGWQFGSGASWGGSRDETANGTLLLLSFHVKDDAPEGEAYVRISHAEAYNENEDEVAVNAVAGKVTVTIRTPGDANGDGYVDGRDTIRIQKYLAGQDVSIDLSNADVTGDGNVDGRDYIRLMKYFAGQDVVLN